MRGPSTLIQANRIHVRTTAASCAALLTLEKTDWPTSKVLSMQMMVYRERYRVSRS
jgi:hypothetical protein